MDLFGKKQTAGTFEDWWTEYPRKLKKQWCARIWKRKRLDSIGQVLIYKLRQQKERCANFNCDRRFIPHPSSYLNQGRWEDDIEPMESILPTADEQLPAYAADNNLPPPNVGESYRAYRARLEAI